ncbi:MAG: hypothetical protein R3Y47_00795 [Lachnospiraceae bacterium]
MSNKYVMELTDGISIKNWVYGQFIEEKYEAPMEPDDLDLMACRAFSTMEEFGSIRYSVRRDYESKVLEKLDKIEYEQTQMNTLYFPLEGDAFELTKFYHQPTHLHNRAKTYITAQESGSYEFLLCFSCYVKIWVNGVMTAQYQPKARNVQTLVPLTLDLEEGDNELMVYMEDIAEREIFFYFQFAYKGSEKLSTYIPVEADLEEIQDKIRFIQSLSLVQEMCIDKAVVKYDNTLIHEPIKIYHRRKEKGVICERAFSEGEADVYVLNQEHDSFELTTLGFSGNSCVFTALVGNVELNVKLVACVYSSEWLAVEPADTLQERKQQLVEFVRTTNVTEIRKILAILELEHVCTEEAVREIYACLDKIDGKNDCADFVLLPLMYVYEKYFEILPLPVRTDIKQTVLNFRYWYDEPGNDVMCFFSENHALLFHGAQYVAGDLFPNEIFTVSGRTGAEQKVYGKKRLDEWFGVLMSRGYDEWNSPTYLPVTMIAYFSLYLLTEGEVKAYAKDALDLTFSIFAENAFKKRYSSACARVYEPSLKGMDLNGVSAFAWLAFSQGKININVPSAMLFALSDYEPPCVDHLVNAEPGKSITVERRQGAHDVHTYIHKTSEYSMASAMEFTPFIDGLQSNMFSVAIGEKAAMFWINNPGELQLSGERRPCYWAGNASLPYMFQYRNVTIGVYNIEEKHLVDFTHVYNPNAELDEHKKVGNWFFAKQGSGYFAVWYSNGFEYTTAGGARDKEIISRGRKQAFVAKCGGESEYGSFEAFINAIKDSVVAYDGERSVVYEDVSYGRIEIDSTNEYRKNGKECSVHIKERYKVTID